MCDMYSIVRAIYWEGKILRAAKIRGISSAKFANFFNKVCVVCGNIAFASTFHSSALWRSQPSCLDSRREDRGSGAFLVSLAHFSPTTNCAQRRQSASDGARGVTLCRLKPDKTTRGEKKNGGGRGDFDKSSKNADARRRRRIQRGRCRAFSARTCWPTLFSLH